MNWVLALKVYSIRFARGCVQIEASPGLARLITGSVEAEFRPRVISWRGVKDVQVYNIRGGKSKVVYVVHDDIVPLGKKECLKPVDDIEEPFIEAYHASINGLDFLTLRMSGIVLVDYVVVSNDLTAILLSGKREIYYEKTGSELYIYIT